MVFNIFPEDSLSEAVVYHSVPQWRRSKEHVVNLCTKQRVTYLNSDVALSALSHGVVPSRDSRTHSG